MPGEGVDFAERQLRRIEKIVIEELNDSLEEAADELLIRSRELAPQLSGDLINDAQVSKFTKRNGLNAYSVNYGDGRSRPYALIQHEAVFNAGPITRLKPGAGRKYLSRAFAERGTKIVRRIRTRLERAIRLAVRT